MRRKARWICALLTIAMALQFPGCGESVSDPGGERSMQAGVQTGASGESAAEGEEESPAESEDAVDTAVADEQADGRISDNGMPISDFYDFVNAGWIKEQKRADPQFEGYCAATQKEMIQRMVALLEQAPEELDPQNDYQKVVCLYRQLLDDEYRDIYGNQKIKAYLDRIDRVKSLKDLYGLYGDENYELCNRLMFYDIYCGGYHYGYPWVQPQKVMGNQEINVTNVAKLENLLGLLGYSEKRAKEIVENAKEMDSLITAAGGTKNWSNNMYFVNREGLEERNVTFPIMDILESLHANNPWQMIVVSDQLLEFWEKAYVPENLQKIKDHMILSGAYSLAITGDQKLQAAYMDLFDVLKFSKQSKEEYIAEGLMNYAGDVMADEYCKTYLDEDVIPLAQELGSKLKKTYRDMIDGKTWLSYEGREFAKAKAFYVKLSYGRNAYPQTLQDVTVSENPTENFIQFRKSRKAYMKTRILELKERRTTMESMFEVNAFFMGSTNAATVCDGVLSLECCGKDAAYEERLGSLGWMIAHELSHSLDPSNIKIDYEGYWNDWMGEKDQEAYTKMLDGISGYFDGKKNSNGKEINGKKITAETFADLTAVAVCMRLLQEREDADYDLFFRTYARMNASTGNQFLFSWFDSDKYLLPKDRVNMVLSMFDEFYETYDIDESSPYYVKPEERIRGL